MAVANPVTRVLLPSLCVDLERVLPSLPIAAANRRCDISGIELMVAFHGWGLLQTCRSSFYYPGVFHRRSSCGRRLRAIFGPDI
jgi:hypothetical protein